MLHTVIYGVILEYQDDQVVVVFLNSHSRVKRTDTPVWPVVILDRAQTERGEKLNKIKQFKAVHQKEKKKTRDGYRPTKGYIPYGH